MQDQTARGRKLVKKRRTYSTGALDPVLLRGAFSRDYSSKRVAGRLDPERVLELAREVRATVLASESK